MDPSGGAQPVFPLLSRFTSNHVGASGQISYTYTSTDSLSPSFFTPLLLLHMCMDDMYEGVTAL